jgi:hypothetical protein
LAKVLAHKAALVSFMVRPLKSLWLQLAEPLALTATTKSMSLTAAVHLQLQLLALVVQTIKLSSWLSLVAVAQVAQSTVAQTEQVAVARAAIAHRMAHQGLILRPKAILHL